MKLAIVALSILAACAQSAKIGPPFKKCYRKEANWDRCVLEAAQDGIQRLTKPYPQFNLLSYSPMEVSQLTISAGSQAVVNVQQNFKECKIYGIPDIKLDTFRINLEERHVKVAGLAPELKLDCQYELNGRILLLPIVGNGPSVLTLKNINFTAHFDFEEIKKNDKTYIHLTTENFQFQPELISFNFENLFNGDKQLGDNINKVLNENHKEVFADVREGYEHAFGRIFQQTLNNFLAAVSVEEAAD